MTNSAINFRDSVLDQIELLTAGKPLEAFDRYFADDGVMYDGDEVFGQGAAECRAKQEPFIASARAITGNISWCSIDGEDSTCAFHNRTEFVDAEGRRHQIDGVHRQRWESGKIVEERYYRVHTAAAGTT